MSRWQCKTERWERVGTGPFGSVSSEAAAAQTHRISSVSEMFVAYNACCLHMYIFVHVPKHPKPAACCLLVSYPNHSVHATCGATFPSMVLRMIPAAAMFSIVCCLSCQIPHTALVICKHHMYFTYCRALLSVLSVL